jgi:hypothetical protein
MSIYCEGEEQRGVTDGLGEAPGAEMKPYANFLHFNMEEKLEDEHHVNDAEQRIHL